MKIFREGTASAGRVADGLFTIRSSPGEKLWQSPVDRGRIVPISQESPDARMLTGRLQRELTDVRNREPDRGGARVEGERALSQSHVSRARSFLGAFPARRGASDG